MDKFYEVKSKFYVRAWKQESVHKPILRDPNGKAIGRSSFWLHQPFDYSNYERDLPRSDYDRIRTQDLTFADRQRRVAADDVSVDTYRPNNEKPLDWQFRTGVKMITRDHTYEGLTEDKKLDMFKRNQEHALRQFTLWQCHNMQMTLKHRKQQAAKLLQEKK